MDAGETVVIASVFYFSIVDEHAKIICTGTAKRSIPNQETANMHDMRVAMVQFYITVCEDELITS